MKPKFGAPKSLDDIVLADIQKHPIWMWVWEAGLEEEAEDETWQCPIVNTTDVTKSMVEPIITLRLKGTDKFASASYNGKDDQLEAISFWDKGKWLTNNEVKMKTPITLVAVPTIRGKKDVEFICTDLKSDRAKRAV